MSHSIIAEMYMELGYLLHDSRSERKLEDFAAVTTEIDGSKKFCFARVTLKAGKKIMPGDLASTNLSGHGSN